MNDRTSKTAYKNDIHTNVVDENNDDIGIYSNTSSKLKQKAKVSPASTHAKRNAKQLNKESKATSLKKNKTSVKVQPLLRTLDKAMIDAPATRLPNFYFG